MKPPRSTGDRFDGLRQTARQIPGLRGAYRRLRRLRRAAAAGADRRLRPVRRDAAEIRDITRLRFRGHHATPSGDSRGVVVSLTTHPARIDHVWIPIETMLRQEQTPDRVVLVLSDAEFATRDVPRKLIEQQRRGLEILWTPQDGRSRLKLVPTRFAYPDATIVTVDDDCYFEPWVVSRLVADAREHSDTVIGHRGREIQRARTGLAAYNDWVKASPATPSERVFLTGVGGVLYPPGALPPELLADDALAAELCPTNDDIWFWALARVGRTPARCLGLSSYRPLGRQRHAPRLETVNLAGGANDIQFAAVIKHFGLHLPSAAQL